MTENHRALDVGLEWRPEWAMILANYHKSQNYLEETSVSTQAVREYLILLWNQYQVASKLEKAKLLDEAIKNTGRHRGSLKRLLAKKSEPPFRRGKGKSVNSYTDDSRRFLKLLWKEMGMLGARRFQAAMPYWIKKWDNRDLDDLSRMEILQMSASTVERILKEEKAKLRRRTNTGTRPGSNKMKTLIPLRDLGVMPTEPGHCEIDCVAHCGGSLSGEHIWTLTVTDILTGHTENEALQSKTGWEVKCALDQIEDRLPFDLKALYMDNGSEFLNEDVHKRFALKKYKVDRENIIKLFRSRPYKKNDQCYVEQKNYTHVRALFGYERLSGKLMVQLMNNIYRKEWRFLTNYFYPQIRLKSKMREGAKIKRTFHEPITPFEMLQPHLSAEKLVTMSSEQEDLNPFDLQKKLKHRLRELQGYNSRPGDGASKYAI